MPNGYDYFLGQGWSPVQSAAIMGNLHYESGLNPFAVGDSGSAFGLAQWHPDRQAMFQRVMGIPIQSSTPLQQYQFVNWELNNSEAHAGNLLRNQGTLGGATNVFMTAYERPANSSSLGGRMNYASQYLKGVGNDLKNTAINFAKTGAMAAMNAILPGSGAVLGALGFGGGQQQQSWFEQFVAWLANVSFVQRLALGLFALILIIGAIYLMGKDSSPITKVVDAVA